jgi:uncharacterized membrane protein YheB (UPF0754 family)
MTLYFLPFISAFIGWFTNWIAIKMLFHPKEPINILGITLHGIFPKRQKQFAEKLGVLVANELISFDDISSKINSPETIQKIIPIVEERVDHFIKTKLTEELPLLSMFIKDKTLDNIKRGIVNEVETMFPAMIGQMTANMKQDLDVEKIVVDKVSNFSSDKLEEILVSIMKKEFKFVEIIGGVLGFLIGLLQIVIAKL